MIHTTRTKSEVFILRRVGSIPAEYLQEDQFSNQLILVTDELMIVELQPKFFPFRNLTILVEFLPHGCPTCNFDAWAALSPDPVNPGHQLGVWCDLCLSSEYPNLTVNQVEEKYMTKLNSEPYGPAGNLTGMTDEELDNFGNLYAVQHQSYTTKLPSIPDQIDQLDTEGND
jgi:hypothetical protein